MHGTKAFLSMPGFIPKERDEEEGGVGYKVEDKKEDHYWGVLIFLLWPGKGEGGRIGLLFFFIWVLFVFLSLFPP